MTVSRRPLRLLSNLVAAIAALVLAGTLDPIAAEAAGWGPLGRVSVAARSASSASKASVYQTQKNSRNYRRAKSKQASRDRAKIRRATRRSRYRRGHQPGGYCMYDTKGNVILRPQGVECADQQGEYLRSTGGAASPPRVAPSTASGCVEGDPVPSRASRVSRHPARRRKRANHAGNFQTYRRLLCELDGFWLRINANNVTPVTSGENSISSSNSFVKYIFH